MIATYGPGSRDCRFDVVEIAALDEWPHALYPAHLLLCLDAREVAAATLADLTGRLLRGGLGAVLCDGPECERAAEAFHEEADAEVTISAHEGGRFADTLFSWAMFLPDPAYPVPDVRTVVLVGQPDRARDVHRWLPAFCARLNPR
jgi:hypothetical protein